MFLAIACSLVATRGGGLSSHEWGGGGVSLLVRVDGSLRNYGWNEVEKRRVGGVRRWGLSGS